MPIGPQWTVFRALPRCHQYQHQHEDEEEEEENTILVSDQLQCSHSYTDLSFPARNLPPPPPNLRPPPPRLHHPSPHPTHTNQPLLPIRRPRTHTGFLKSIIASTPAGRWGDNTTGRMGQHERICGRGPISQWQILPCSKRETWVGATIHASDQLQYPRLCTYLYPCQSWVRWNHRPIGSQ